MKTPRSRESSSSSSADDALTRRATLAGGAGALLAALAGCSTGPSGSEPSGMGTDTEPSGTGTTTTSGDESMDWRTTELTDVTTGETFTLDQFGDRPVLVEFFAVWCPICTDQQRAIASLLSGTDDVVAVSLNVNPNEDAARVRSHAEDHGFGWRYAVSPPSTTEALVDEFGTVVTNPPSAPVVRLCPGGAANLVDGSGVKSADTLAAAAERC